MLGSVGRPSAGSNALEVGLPERQAGPTRRRQCFLGCVAAAGALVPVAMALRQAWPPHGRAFLDVAAPLMQMMPAASARQPPAPRWPAPLRSSDGQPGAKSPMQADRANAAWMRPPGQGPDAGKAAQNAGSRRPQAAETARAATATLDPKVEAPPTEAYGKRLQAALRKNDPAMLLVGRRQSAEAARLLALPHGSVTESQRAWAKQVVASTRHPIGGNYIFRPLRVAAFPWMNVPIVSMFLLAGSLQAILALQVVNQLFNASFNIANGACGAAGASKRKMARNFFAATSVACVVAMVGQSLQDMVACAAQGVLSRWFVPFISAVSADVVNVGFSRFDEYTKGVPVCDRSGRQLTTSRVAGRAVVAKALATRSFLLPFVALFLPTTLSAACQAAFPAMSNLSAPATMMVDVALVAVTLAVGLPVCIALFPEVVRLPLRRLEPAAQAVARTACEPSEPPADVFVYRGV